MANHRFGLCRSSAKINLPAWSVCNDFMESWADVRAPLCFKVQKSSRRARSRPLKATLEKDPRERWIIGLSDLDPLRRLLRRESIAPWGTTLAVPQGFLFAVIPHAAGVEEPPFR